MSLRGAKAKGRLNLVDANWAGRADFRESDITDLSWASESSPSSVKGVFDAREAEFKKAVIKDIYFSDLADFSDTELGKEGKVIFENVTFEKEVDFLRAKFWNDAVFVRNRFRGVWDLTGITFEEQGDKERKERANLCLSFNRISKLFIEENFLSHERTEDSFLKRFLLYILFPLDFSPLKRSRIRSVKDDGTRSCADLASLNETREENKSGDKSGTGEKETNEELQDIYKTIELSFREANDRRGENEAWYLRQVARQESQYSAVECWGSLILSDIPSRHGIDIYRVVWVSIFLWLFFAGIYWAYLYRQIEVNRREAWVRLKPPPDQKRAFRFRPVEPFFKGSGKQARPLQPLKDALFLSGRAFFKLGLGSTYPRRPVLEHFQ